MFKSEKNNNIHPHHCSLLSLPIKKNLSSYGACREEREIFLTRDQDIQVKKKLYKQEHANAWFSRYSVSK